MAKERKNKIEKIKKKSKMTSLYIHIPFCDKKCFYCSFVVFVGQQNLVNYYLKALSKEAEYYRDKEVATIYIGGGTPTLLDEKQIRFLFDIIKSNFIYNEETEFTIEANPEGLSLKKLFLLKSLGVNRLSLGVQSMSDKNLKYLGRVHNSALAYDALKNIKDAGFDNFNVDMIYGLPGQSDEEIKEDINKILQFESTHISLYSLTIGKNSKFYANKIKLSDNGIQAEQYMIVENIIKKAEFKQYEISNFSRIGMESKHNVNYWKCGDYVGLGVGAHSHIADKRYWNVSKVRNYIKLINAGLSTEEGCEYLTFYDRMMEALLFGLRMNEGVDIKFIESEYKIKMPDKLLRKIRALKKEGYIIREGNNIRTSEKGMLVLDEICAHLI